MGISVPEQLYPARMLRTAFSTNLEVAKGEKREKAGMYGSLSFSLDTTGTDISVACRTFGIVASGVADSLEPTGKISVNGMGGLGALTRRDEGRWFLQSEIQADVLYWEIQRRFGFREFYPGRLDSPVERFTGILEADLVERDAGEQTPNWLEVESGVLRLNLVSGVLGLFERLEIAVTGLSFAFRQQPSLLAPCPVNARLERRTLRLRPLGFGTSEDDPNRSGTSWDRQLIKARAIWGGCCLTIAADPIEIIPRPEFATSTDIDGIVVASGPYQRAGFIEVLLVKSQLPNGGGRTPSAGTGSDKIVMTDLVLPGNPFLLAHELGHVLSGLHPMETPVTQHQWEGNPGTILEASGFGNPNPTDRPINYCTNAWNPGLSAPTSQCCGAPFPP